MVLYIFNHKFHYEMENLCRVFFPHEKIEKIYGEAKNEEQFYVETKFAETDGAGRIDVNVKLNDGTYKSASVNCGNTAGSDEAELKMAVLLFGLLSERTGYRPAWGVLTGVRPAKLMRKLREEYGEESAVKYFKDSLLVSDAKTRLALEVEKNERKIIENNAEKDYSLYISIPFCPTRCAYCSFVSHSMDKARKLLPDYLKLLEREIEYTAGLANRLGLRLRTVYIGGGTPTTLDAFQMDSLLKSLEKCFNASGSEEYTVEAGRPDTVDGEKLNVIHSHGVTRISINPQTFNDDALEAIGRRHSSAQTLKAYELARRCGFKNINMDLIAGLPRDTEETFKKTIDITTELGPESVTVHTLALKRSSYMVMDGGYSYTTEADLTAKQLDIVMDSMKKYGYLPYYMYRQSRTVGNLENVGYAFKGFECMYNVYMMDETHTVLACGAGAVTKLKEYGTNRIDRVYNFKYPYEYIGRFDELLQRKQAIMDFYSKKNQ